MWLRILFASCLFFVLPASAGAADLTVTPESASVRVGGTYTFSVYVQTPNEAINAVSGTIALPPQLELVSVSTDSSIVNFWVEKPIDTHTKQLSFEGVVLNPGYEGARGAILTFVVRGVEPGTGTIRFTQGAVYANDGEGTHVLKDMKSAAVTVTVPPAILEEPASPKTVTAPISTETAAPLPSTTTVVRIRAAGFENPDAWSSITSSTIGWDTVAGARSVRVKHTANGVAKSSVVLPEGTTSHTISVLEEGTNTITVDFLIQGTWGSSLSTTLRVDATLPDFISLEEVPRTTTTSGRVRLAVRAKDIPSGIDHYAFTIDGATVEWRDDGTGIFETLLAPGSYVVQASVVDKAGNESSREISVAVEALPEPSVTLYPATIDPEVSFEVKGTGTPGHIVEAVFYEVPVDTSALEQGAASIVALHLRKPPRQSKPTLAAHTTVLADGTFTIPVPGSLASGRYDVWVVSRDGADGQSYPQGPYRIVVTSPTSALFSDALSSFGAVLLVFACIAVFLLAVGALTLWKYIGFKKVVRREVGEVEQSFERAFRMMREEVALELGKLSRNEPQDIQKKAAAVMQALSSNINDTRTFIHEEMSDLERVVHEPLLPKTGLKKDSK
jgi:hypothetical protein